MRKIQLPFNTPSEILKSNRMMRSIKSSSEYKLYHSNDKGPYLKFTKAGYTPQNQPKKPLFKQIKENIEWKIQFNKAQKQKRQLEKMPVITAGYYPPQPPKKQTFMAQVREKIDNFKWKMRGDEMQ